MHPAAVHAFAAERRQEGRVRVDDATPKGRDHRRRHQLQISGQHQQIDPVLPKRAQP
jgi:hypothetical protein